MIVMEFIETTRHATGTDRTDRDLKAFDQHRVKAVSDSALDRDRHAELTR
jgi:hypothetical protein